MQKRESTFQNFTLSQTTGGTAKGAKLSWRVHLLPFLGEPELYEEFRFDEAWDGPHNKPLLSRIPSVYSLGDKGFKTRFQVFAGDGLLFGANREAVLRAINDGPEKTILIVATASDKAVPWTQPDDLDFNPDNPAEALGNVSTIECVLANGALAMFPAKTAASELAAFITPSGSESAKINTYLVDDRRANPTGNAGRKNSVRQVASNLKQMGRAMGAYFGAHKEYPVANDPGHIDDQGIPKLSWRVHLLKYLNEADLYDQFKLDERWDSAHNKALLSKMPDIYRHPSDDAETTKTRFMVIRGGGALFETKGPPDQRKLSDPTNFTVLVLLVGPDKAVEWTKPEDVEFDPLKPKAILGEVGDVIEMLLQNGSLTALKPSIPDELFRSLVKADGPKRMTWQVLKPWELR